MKKISCFIFTFVAALCMCSCEKVIDGVEYPDYARMYIGDRDEYQSFGKGFRTLSLMGVGEYRFNVNRTVCVFGGVGLGVSQRAATGWEGPMFGFAAAPRVGLQVNNHARIFFDVLLTSRYFNAVSMNFGWAF